MNDHLEKSPRSPASEAPRRRRGQRRAVSCAVAAFLVTPASGAQAETPRVELDAHSTSEWRDAAKRAEAALAGRSDIDTLARVEVMGAGDAAILHVVLADGRSAVRRLSRPADLAGALESLLLLPPPELPPPPDTHAQLDAPAPPRPPAPEGSHVQLGLGASARLSFPPGYFGYGPVAFAEIASGDWIVGILARWDVDDIGLSSGLPVGFNMQSVAIGVTVGRRLLRRDVELVALVGASASIDNQDAVGAGVEGPGGTVADIAANAIVRATLPPTSAYRFFSALELDVYPRRLRGTHFVDVGLPALAPWATSVSAGVAWSSL